MNNQTRIAILWLIMVICMILHFNYHVSGIFYGIDVQRPDANGIQPPTLIIIRGLFHVLPMILLLVALFFDSKIVRLGTLAAAIIYVPMHAAHVVGTFKETPLDPTQLLLLVFTFVSSIVLAYTAWKWFKELKQA